MYSITPDPLSIQKCSGRYRARCHGLTIVQEIASPPNDTRTVSHNRGKSPLSPSPNQPKRSVYIGIYTDASQTTRTIYIVQKKKGTGTKRGENRGAVTPPWFHINNFMHPEILLSLSLSRANRRSDLTR